jgi:hypothetical protein
MDAMTAFYAALPHLRDVRPVRLTIPYKGRETTHAGIRYVAVGHYTADMMACQRGEQTPGGEYTSESMLFLGDLPPSYKKKVKLPGLPYAEAKFYYVVPGEPGHWYVSHYITTEGLRDFRSREPEAADSLHPFGHSWGMGHSTRPLDDWEAPYKELLTVRVEVAGVELGPGR